MRIHSFIVAGVTVAALGVSVPAAEAAAPTPATVAAPTSVIPVERCDDKAPQSPTTPVLGIGVAVDCTTDWGDPKWQWCAVYVAWYGGDGPGGLETVCISA